MARYANLTKFIPALEGVIPGEWVDRGMGRAPGADYWDVVHRFSDAVYTLAGELEEAGEPVPGVEYLHRIRAAIDSEDEIPGVLLGLFANGSILEWLNKLREIDEKE